MTAYLLQIRLLERAGDARPLLLDVSVPFEVNGDVSLAEVEASETYLTALVTAVGRLGLRMLEVPT